MASSSDTASISTGPMITWWNIMPIGAVPAVSTLAPFLTFNPDPYIVIGQDGRLYWIMDAFTTSDSFLRRAITS